MQPKSVLWTWHNHYIYELTAAVLFEQDLHRIGSTNGSPQMGKNHKAHLPKGVGAVNGYQGVTFSSGVQQPLSCYASVNNLHPQRCQKPIMSSVGRQQERGHESGRGGGFSRREESGVKMTKIHYIHVWNCQIIKRWRKERGGRVRQVPLAAQRLPTIKK